MNLKKLIKLLELKFKNIDSNQVIEKITIYKNFLQQENKIHNLTRLDKDEEIYQKYFYESILNFYDDLFDRPNLNVLDIGSGSGVPGIVLKILFPHINLYIVESNLKKVNFLNNLVSKLNLNNVKISNQRCEDYIKDKINFFDLITCRAVAELRILLELSIPGLKIGGIGFFLKSTNYLIELKNSKNISNKLNIIDNPKIEIINYDDKKFVSLKYIKENETNSIFPRSWKEIINNDKD